MEVYDYERTHSAFVREHGAECTVLLKKDGTFPLKKPGSIALYGSCLLYTSDAADEL